MAYFLTSPLDYVEDRNQWNVFLYQVMLEKNPYIPIPEKFISFPVNFYLSFDKNDVPDHRQLIAQLATSLDIRTSFRALDPIFTKPIHTYTRESYERKNRIENMIGKGRKVIDPVTVILTHIIIGKTIKIILKANEGSSIILLE